MNAGYQKLRSRVLVAVLSLLMVFGNVASPISGVVSVYATDDQFETALADDQTPNKENQAAAASDADENSESPDAQEDSEGSDEEADAEDQNQAADAEDDEDAESAPAEEATEANQDAKTMTRSASVNAVYVDGVKGNDDNDGLAAETAVKTWTKAKEIIGNNAGTIYVCGTVTVDGEVSTANPSSQVVKRAEGFKGNIFKVDAEKKNATFKNIHIDGEEVQATGTAIAFEQCADGSLTIGENALIENLKCTGSGAAVYASGCTNASFNVKDGASFINNQTGRCGGAIYIDNSSNSTIDISESEFSKNKSNGRSNEGGGAICIWSSHDVSLKIGKAEFKENYANGLGGAICFEKKTSAKKLCEVTIDGAKFIGNEAKDSGGAVWLNGEYTTNVYSARFENNKAKYGSALVNTNHNSENHITIQNALVTGNESTSTNCDDVKAGSNHGGLAGGVNICDFAGTELVISADITTGAAIFDNSGEMGDIGVWKGSDRTKIKKNEGNMLGGGKINLIGNIIEQEFTVNSNWYLGSGLSLVMMVFIIASMLLLQKFDKTGGQNLI